MIACPYCFKELDFIEFCECDKSEEKSSYSCDNDGCEVGIVYVIKFKT
jgi:uncharacterized lipoprotein YehR (DUF1307 family)